MELIRIGTKSVLFIIVTTGVVIVQPLLLLVHKGKHAYFIPRLWQRAVRKIFGIKVEITGHPYTDDQTIYISNHLSYLDIPVIGSTLKASFVAKEDLAGWPVFGFLSKLQQTAFISRARKDAKKEKHALDNMLNEGKSLILFPEGTSSDGSTVLPFKSSLFSIALKNDSDRDITIQPITLKIIQVNGENADKQHVRDLYSWHGDMTLSPHLLSFMKCRGATISMTFHQTYKASDFDCRKALSKECYGRVCSPLTKEMAKEVIENTEDRLPKTA